MPRVSSSPTTPIRWGWATTGSSPPAGPLISEVNTQPPNLQITAVAFGPGGNTIYATYDADRSPRPTTYIEELSLSWKVVRRFGTLPNPTVISTDGDGYRALAIATNGDAWVLRIHNELYRFHVG
jgi:hypothetical protein